MHLLNQKFKTPQKCFWPVVIKAIEMLKIPKTLFLFNYDGTTVALLLLPYQCSTIFSRWRGATTHILPNYGVG